MITLIKTAGRWGNNPRVIISPNGDIIDIPDNSYHSSIATEIWNNIDPNRVNSNKGNFRYQGYSPLHDLINEKKYIAFGGSGEQAIRGDKRTLKDMSNKGTIVARMLAKQWTTPYFEAEFINDKAGYYYVKPFVDEGKFIPTNETPTETNESDLAKDFFENNKKRTYIKDIKKMLDEIHYPDDVEILNRLKLSYEKLSILFKKRAFYNAAKISDTIIKLAGFPRVLIDPLGQVINIEHGSYHGLEAAKIWQKIDPSKIRVDQEDGSISYPGGSALYDLIEFHGYIALGTANSQELKANKKVITNPTNPATLTARRLAKQWFNQYFEAELDNDIPKIYYVSPFIKYGKFVRKDLKYGPLQDFEELPENFTYTLSEDSNPNDFFDVPQASGDSIRSIRKNLYDNKYPDDIPELRKRRAYRLSQLIKY